MPEYTIPKKDQDWVNGSVDPITSWALTDIRANHGDLLNHTVIDEYGGRLLLRSYHNAIRSFTHRCKSVKWTIVGGPMGARTFNS